MSAELATVSYIGATILFILSLGGLSNQTTALRGNLYGMIGMTLAVLATVFGPKVTMAGIPWIVVAMLIGAGIGIYAARTVQMTQMPELVALMHSMVGLAAMLVGFATFIDPEASKGFEVVGPHRWQPGAAAGAPLAQPGGLVDRDLFWARVHERP